MAILLGSAYGKVGLDASGVKKGTKEAIGDLKKLQAQAVDIGNAMKDVGNKLTLGVTLPLAALGTASLKLATDFEETRNKTMVVFEDMADSIVRNSNKSARALGINKEAYMDYASSIGAALKAGGMGIKETTELSEQAVKHFADLASFHNAQVEEVAAAWQSAIRGQYEPIQRYFPFITNEYLKTYGIANGLLDANTQTLTANQRAIIMNAIALDEKLNPALDDFAETSGGLANQMRIMDAQFKDSLVMLGQNLLPIALKVVTALNGMLEKFNEMSPAAQKATLGFGVFLAMLGPGISLAGTLLSTLASLSAIMTNLGIALPAVSAGVAGTGAAAGGATAAVGGLGAALATLGSALLVVLPALAILYFAFKYNFGGIRTTAEQLWFVLKWGAKRTMESLKVTLGQLGFIIQWAFQKALNAIVDVSQTRLRQITEIFARLKQRIMDVFKGGDIGKFIVYGIVNGIMGAIPWLAQAVKYIAATILNGLRKSLGIRSPSEEGEYFGRMVARGLVQGMQAEQAALSSAARDSANTVIKQFTNAQQAFKAFLTANGYSGGSQFKPATSGNMQAAFKEFLAANGGGGGSQFKPPTSSNMQAAFQQFAQAQAQAKADTGSRFREKEQPVRVEQVNYFSSGLTVRQAQDIYSEKLKDSFSFLEKNLGN